MIDGTEQQGRKETIEIHGIPEEGPREDCYSVVLGVLSHHLNMNLQKTDISVCHRQIIPSDKKLQGSKYIPPIYCKMVHRFRARDIVAKFKRLKNPMNKYGKPFAICENLTYERRSLWETVESKLTHYPQKWIKNGKIFLKKSEDSFPIKITSRNSLNKLLPTRQKIPPKVSAVEVSSGSSSKNVNDKHYPPLSNPEVQSTPSVRDPAPAHSSTYAEASQSQQGGNDQPAPRPTVSVRSKQQHIRPRFVNQPGPFRQPRMRAQYNYHYRPRSQAPSHSGFRQQGPQQNVPRYLIQNNRPLNSFSHTNRFEVLSKHNPV